MALLFVKTTRPLLTLRVGVLCALLSLAVQRRLSMTVACAHSCDSRVPGENYVLVIYFGARALCVEVILARVDCAAVWAVLLHYRQDSRPCISIPRSLSTC